jgi:phenylacetate-CoA ligase
MGKAVGPALREIEAFDLNWRKFNFAHIGNFNSCRIDLVYQEHFYKYFKPIFFAKNSLDLDVSTTITDMINKLNEFKPNIILSYPAIFQHLAFLKRKGYGENLSPSVLYSAGSMLDDYTRKYVKDVFKCPLLNSYQSVEAHGSIATECIEGTWHVHHDFYNVEAIDENGELVASGERGHLVMTRMWGIGTPIVRYTGMDDWVRIIPLKDCKCGLSTPVIKGGVEGRIRANIVLPNGKIFPPGAFCFIEPVLYKYKTFKVMQYQIVQNKIDDIDVFFVIDENLRNEGVSVKTLIKEIKKIYEKKVGPDVTINVEEVSEIKNPNDASKPPPIVVSNVKSKDGYKILDQ